MAGLSDYLAQKMLQFETGTSPMPSLASRYLALFTTAPTSDAGTGGTEVSGGAYARIQVAGAIAAAASFTTSSTTITMGASAPAWVAPGMNVFDATSGLQVGTVSSYSGTTLTLTAPAANASSGSTDSLVFSAWPAATASSGSEPSVTPAQVTNGSTITFPTATASWGTVTAFGLYDAVTGGNLITWDYIGNNKWIPFSCTSASPGVLTCDVASDAPANSTPCVVTAKFGGTLPTTGGSWAGVLTSAGLSGATFNLGVNTTSIGGGMFRPITQQSIPSGVTASFSASTLTLTAA